MSTTPKPLPPQPSQPRTPVADPTGQSPDAPIKFDPSTAVGRGNAERANAEPEPQALHSAKTPGVVDPAKQRREIEHDDKQ